MNEQGYDIPGLPEGWEAVAYRPVKNGEHWLNSGGISRHDVSDKSETINSYVVLRRKQPPAPTYRPFANAAEFKPFRDKWWRYKGSNLLQPPREHTDAKFSGKRWDECLTDLEFEDGTPFGVEVK